MELNKTEGEWIRKTECVNRFVAGRTTKEYRADNADQISARMKQYYKDNADEIKAKRKANKDRINARQRELRKEKKEQLVTQ
eukprot:1251606-Prymnesium_polylepis.1